MNFTTRYPLDESYSKLLQVVLLLICRLIVGNVVWCSFLDVVWCGINSCGRIFICGVDVCVFCAWVHYFGAFWNNLRARILLNDLMIRVSLNQ